MDLRASDLAARHRGTKDVQLAELIAAIASGAVELHSLSADASSSELAQTYEIRSGIAMSQGRDLLAKQMLFLSQKCRSNDGGSCAIWSFNGAVSSYAVFELQPSKEVAACFKFNGSLLGDKQAE